MSKEIHPNSMANLKRWKPGESGNPRGLTPEIRQRIQRNCEKMAMLQEIKANALLKVAQEMAAAGREQELVDALVKTEINGFERDVMDRALGKAGQQLDLISSDESMSPRQAESEAVLAALARKHGIES